MLFSIFRGAQLEQIKETDNLTSEKGIDYTRLRDLLKTGQWKAADRETAERMLEVLGWQEQDRLQLEDMQDFPCTDLRTIDQLWVKYSNGKFGFSVQRKIWQQYRKPKEYFDLVRFGEAVGWNSRNEWLDYIELTFNLSAPEGHLPGKITRISWILNEPSKVAFPPFARKAVSSVAVSFGTLGVMEHLFSRLEACQI
ncbi:GUN4 domain-containing protein [Pantanalinema rosaneae CENA516]|uniref:GUN4 domain-containing protein n=1 Tax=Pantanalinema rosaneae TaxID=1620701 RepID=UPI003D6FD2C2